MSNSSSNSVEKLPPHFRELRTSNPEEIINAYIAANPGPLTAAIRTTLDALGHIDIRPVIRKIIDTLTDADFREQFLEAIKVRIETHPWHTGFFVIGVVLLANPLATVGFGSLGPVAGRDLCFSAPALSRSPCPSKNTDVYKTGSIAAAWQSTIGGLVAAGSAFAILQSLGMLGSVLIPVVGAGVVGATAVAAIAENEGVRNAVIGAGRNPVGGWWGSLSKL